MRIVENIAIATITDRMYPFLKSGYITGIDESTKKDIFKKAKALLGHKIAYFVVLGSDSIIISVFLGLKTVGLYSNYYLIITAIMNLIGQLFTSITASVGNLLIKDDPKKSYEVYNKVRFANFWLACIATTGFVVTIDSFITLWLGDEYVLSLGVLLALGVNLYLQLIRAVTNSFKEAAGIFHEDRFVPIIESLVNIIFSIIFLQFFGLAGVFIGTACSNLVLHLFSYPKYVYTQIFKRSYRNYYGEFLHQTIIAVIIVGVTFAISRMIHIESSLYTLLVNVIISLLLPSVIFFTIYRKASPFIYYKQILSKIINKIFRHHI
jgi:O-antigen/teichoic acid export membrane protein